VPCLPYPGVQVSLLNALNLPDHSVPNHLVFPWRRFVTLRASAQRARPPSSFSAVLSGLLSSWIQASPFPSRLAEYTRPKRVRHPTDWSFASCCSPPRLTATQLQAATGCSEHLERTCTSLIKYARRRTGPDVHVGAPKAQEVLIADAQKSLRGRGGKRTSCCFATPTYNVGATHRE